MICFIYSAGYYDTEYLSKLKQNGFHIDHVKFMKYYKNGEACNNVISSYAI